MTNHFNLDDFNPDRSIKMVMSDEQRLQQEALQKMKQQLKDERILAQKKDQEEGQGKKINNGKNSKTSKSSSTSGAVLKIKKNHEEKEKKVNPPNKASDKQSASTTTKANKRKNTEQDADGSKEKPDPASKKQKKK